MFLSRIEMTGFKSFADKTVIEFDQGITAVVGPNGSGKSNLSEAIRWVLGEQSAKSLRGSKMEDVIFNGTQKRKAVNLAKVTIVLNNEDRYLDYDFSEISLTRSYNRNGESHYYINNEACRLKDIVDLLLDSGLGKNNFSMISQGKVENIFLNKPEERRGIFEEAAGVQKYQVRKNEAERKLNKSADHLSRVKDIVHELESQINPLEKQRTAAITYLDQQESLNRLEISLYTHQIEEYRQQWKKAEEELEIVNKELALEESNANKIKQELQFTQVGQDETIAQIDQQTDVYQAKVQQLEQAKAKQQMLQQQISFDQSSQKDKQQQYNSQLSRKDIVMDDLNSAKKTLSQLQEDRKESLALLTIKEEEKKKITGLDEKEIEEIRSVMIDWYQKEATAKNQLKQSQDESQRTQQQIKRIESQNQQALKQLEKLEAEKLQQQSELISNKSDANELQVEVQAMMADVQKAREQRENLQKQLFNHERAQNVLGSKIDSLKQMQADYSGYYAGVRAVMTQADRLSGIEGTVADLIKVPEQFQTAIDQALGASLQQIVVTDDHAARQAIQYLKKQSAGRATFLPRTNIKSRSLNNQLEQTARQHQGFVGIADEIIQFSDENRAILSNLLGTTVIIDGIENAQSLSKQTNFRLKIVTLAGEVLMPGGSISGGRTKQQANSMLSRQNDIQKYEEDFNRGQKQQSLLEENWKENEDLLNNFASTYDQKKQKLSEFESTIHYIEQKISQLNLQEKQINNQLSMHKSDLSEAKLILAISKEEIEQAHTTMEEAREAIQSLDDQLVSHNLSEEERKQQITKLDQEIQTLYTQHAVNEVEEKQQKQLVLQLETQLEELNQFIQHFQESNYSWEENLEQLEEQLEDRTSEIMQLSTDSEALQKLLQELRNKRQDLNSRLRELENQSEVVSKKIQTTYQKQATLEAKIEKFENYIDNHLDYLNQEHQLSYEAAIKEAETIESATKVQNEIRQIKQKIASLGPINLAAIDDYEALFERYTHLKEQQDDLLLAIDQLQQTMDEMDEEVIKRFSETFNQINHQFQKTFRRLFGGGEASLQLTDPNNLLTTGVDIIAQPPGKRKQQLALLSGGERAFTAIALLFAILETRPVPFCVLDEVEAALDDANVDRYGQYLQNFTENTQFIVITHRKGTMEHADVLYGVTMQESGVSKLASVSLSEADFD